MGQSGGKILEETGTEENFSYLPNKEVRVSEMWSPDQFIGNPNSTFMRSFND